ncbi:ATP-binding protein [Streptomyces sp. NBC_00076]|uniref:ATP-binding protein n=1 Tax=Streptomyces sp. NBC_00076 TaxID=2975642 RepID=UPI00325185CC
MRFRPTPRGARLARRLVVERLDAWGHPHTSTANETLTLITAELTANAVRHGHVPGRDFEVRLTGTGRVLRVEWGTMPRVNAPGKTVWAVLVL